MNGEPTGIVGHHHLVRQWVDLNDVDEACQVAHEGVHTGRMCYCHHPVERSVRRIERRGVKDNHGVHI